MWAGASFLSPSHHASKSICTMRVSPTVLAGLLLDFASTSCALKERAPMKAMTTRDKKTLLTTRGREDSMVNVSETMTVLMFSASYFFNLQWWEHNGWVLNCYSKTWDDSLEMTWYMLHLLGMTLQNSTNTVHHSSKSYSIFSGLSFIDK